MCPARFYIESCSKGKDAYKEANNIADRINDHMDSKRKAVRRKSPMQQVQGTICKEYMAGAKCFIHSDKDWVCGSKPCVFSKRTLEDAV